MENAVEDGSDNNVLEFPHIHNLVKLKPLSPKAHKAYVDLLTKLHKTISIRGGHLLKRHKLVLTDHGFFDLCANNLDIAQVQTKRAAKRLGRDKEVIYGIRDKIQAVLEDAKDLSQNREALNARILELLDLAGAFVGVTHNLHRKKRPEVELRPENPFIIDACSFIEDDNGNLMPVDPKNLEDIIDKELNELSHEELAELIEHGQLLTRDQKESITAA